MVQSSRSTLALGRQSVYFLFFMWCLFISICVSFGGGGNGRGGVILGEGCACRAFRVYVFFIVTLPGRSVRHVQFSRTSYRGLGKKSEPQNP